LNSLFKIILVFGLALLHTVGVANTSLSDSLKLAINTTTSIDNKCEAIYQLSSFVINDNIDSSITLAQTGLELAKEHNLTLLEIRFQLRLVQANFYLDSLHTASNLLSDLSERPESDWDNSTLEMYYIILGLVNDATGKTSEAIESYLKGLEIAKSNKDTANIGMFLNNLSRIYFTSDTISLAIEKQKEALYYFQKVGHTNYITNAYINLGNYYLNSNLLDSSLIYLNKAITRLSVTQDKYGLIKCYANYGEVYLRQNNQDSSIYYYKKSLQLINNSTKGEILNTSETQVEILESLATTYLQFNQLDSAVWYIQKANRLSTVISVPRALESLAHSSYQIYERIGKIDSALVFYKRYHTYKNEVVKEENAESISNILLLQQLELTKAQHAEELKSEKENRIILFWLFGSLTSLLVMLIVIIYFRFQLNKQKLANATLEKNNISIKNTSLKQELDTKNRELATKMMYLLKKNEFILSVSSRLKEIQSLSSEGEKDKLYPILKDLEKMSEDELWEEFEIRFKEVHQSFYDKLTTKFPNLTANDLKMCAFIKLNLSIKEVASITYQSTESIKTARYRLRKKLEISRETNLVAFLNSI